MPPAVGVLRLERLDQGSTRQLLQARRPVHRRQALTDCLVVDRELRGPQPLDAGNSGRGIVDLMGARQCRRWQIETEQIAVVAEAGGGRCHLPFPSHAEQRHGQPSSFLRDHLGAHLALTADHRRHGAFQDACLFAGDAFECVAQEAGVVVADRRDRREHGVDHIGGVATAAHADLEDREVGWGAGECEEGRHRQLDPELGAARKHL